MTVSHSAAVAIAVVAGFVTVFHSAAVAIAVVAGFVTVSHSAAVAIAAAVASEQCQRGPQVSSAAISC